MYFHRSLPTSINFYSSWNSRWLPYYSTDFHRLLRFSMSFDVFPPYVSTDFHSLPYSSCASTDLHLLWLASIYFLHRFAPTCIDFHVLPYISSIDFHWLPWTVLLPQTSSDFHLFTRPFFCHHRSPINMSMNCQESHDNSTGFYIRTSMSFLRSYKKHSRPPPPLTRTLARNRNSTTWQLSRESLGKTLGRCVWKHSTNRSLPGHKIWSQQITFRLPSTLIVTLTLTSTRDRLG